MQDKILRIILWLIIFIAIVHLASLVFYFYVDFWWLDIAMHFLGGAWGTLFLLWLIFFAADSPAINKIKQNHIFLFVLAILFNLLVSFFWEVFELKAGITDFTKYSYLSDTISDFASALSGGLLSILYFHRNLRFFNKDVGEQKN